MPSIVRARSAMHSGTSERELADIEIQAAIQDVVKLFLSRIAKVKHFGFTLRAKTERLENEVIARSASLPDFTTLCQQVVERYSEEMDSADMAAEDAARDCLRLTKKLTSLQRLVLSYPREAGSRARKISQEAIDARLRAV